MLLAHADASHTPPWTPHRTPKHKLHVGLGVFWAACFPLGIPLALLYALHRSRVPNLAGWKRDCAWLRALVNRGTVLGLHLETQFNPDAITTEVRAPWWRSLAHAGN